MINAISIDDEPKAAEVIRSHVSKIDSLLLLECFQDPVKALTFLQQNPVDLIFLDVNMPNISGMELLEKLQWQPLVIFTTAYSHFAVDSYAHNAVDYLLKPFEFARFKIAINKAQERMETQKKTEQFFLY